MVNAQIASGERRIEKVAAYARDLLSKLPPYLTYHNADHTLHPVTGVVAIADRYGRQEKLPANEHELLLVSAYLHDAGFVRVPRIQANEKEGVAIAQEYLPSLGYQPHEIAIVGSAILATDKRTRPSTKLEMILKDADLDNLGREDFFEMTEAFRIEKGIKNREAWYRETLDFLKSHMFYTQAARDFREGAKQHNILRLDQMLREEELSMFIPFGGYP